MEIKVGTYQGQSLLIPQMISKEKEMLYASQVLIPTNAADKRLALMGPLTVFEILKDTIKTHQLSLLFFFPHSESFLPLFSPKP